MRKFRIRIDFHPEQEVLATDLPDILINKTSIPIVYYIKTGHVEYDQITALNSSYKNLIYHYKRATIGEL